MSTVPRRHSVTCAEELDELVNAVGVLPFFHVDGLLCLEDFVHPSRWFTSLEGPWEWKGRLAREKRCVYGKLLHGGAAFVSLDLFPELVLVRRDGYDFEGMWEDGLASRTDHDIMAQMTGPRVSKAVRRAIGSPKDYDRELIRLQMQTFLIPVDFVYDVDRQGRPYGWGNALLDTPEHFFGEDYVNCAMSVSPEEAVSHMEARMAPLLARPDTDLAGLIADRPGRKSRGRKSR